MLHTYSSYYWSLMHFRSSIVILVPKTRMFNRKWVSNSFTAGGHMNRQTVTYPRRLFWHCHLSTTRLHLQWWLVLARWFVGAVCDACWKASFRGFLVDPRWAFALVVRSVPVIAVHSVRPSASYPEVAWLPVEWLVGKALIWIPFGSLSLVFCLLLVSAKQLLEFCRNDLTTAKKWKEKSYGCGCSEKKQDWFEETWHENTCISKIPKYRQDCS